VMKLLAYFVKNMGLTQRYKLLLLCKFREILIK
jgi:hypothetical protein